MNAAFSELAKAENCAFVSTYGVVPNDSLHQDGVHPDAAGHAKIAKVMLPAVIQAARVALPPSEAQSTANQSTLSLPTGLGIRLWDGTAPNVPANAGEEVLGPDGRTKNVSIPILTAYLPDKKLANGTAIIMVSGGAYTQLALKKYADLGMGAFSPRGIAVFNLKYRLSSPSKNVRADALADAKRAVRLVRSRAAEWGINPNRIGLIGASAGANLILNLMSTADAGQPDSPDAIERQSSRPNFAGLLSSWPGGQKITSFKLSKETPLFLLHAEDDKSAPVEFAREIEAAAKQESTPMHAEYFPTGGHDAFGNLRGPYGEWPQRFLTWLEAQGMLAKSARK
jgi:endo-1,4-beta-xylanase